MYRSINHSSLKEINITYCYLCGRSFGTKSKKNKDHIIPNALIPGAEHKPQVWVHSSCNNRKKLQDQRMKYRINLMASVNDAAAQNFNVLVDKAKQELPYDRLVGYSHKTTNLRLLRTLLNGSEWGQKVNINGQELIELRMHKSHGEDVNHYFRKMMRGLIVRNLSEVHVPLPRITWQIYPQLSLNGKFEENMSTIGRLYTLALNSSNLFMQEWSNKAIYFGATVVDNPKRGFIYIEFFEQFGVLADF